MEINVVKNAKRNIIVGAISKIVALGSPFIIRTFVEISFGSEYLGLNSLFSSVLTVLSLSELGFSSAIVYSMYKPVAEGDVKTVNALLNFYRKAYAVVGLVILGIGLALIPFLKFFIKGDCPPDMNLNLLYLICLSNTVISYFMFAYKSSLIVVYQRDDINSSTNAIVTIFLTIAQVIALKYVHNYVLFMLMMPLFTIINNLRIAFVVNKMFPQYHCEGKLSKEMLADIKQKISGTVISKVSIVSRNSFDSLCTSTFIGLVVTAIYNNYYSIIAAATSMFVIISTALTGGVGNHVATKSKEENFEELKKLDFVYMWLSTVATVCLLCEIQPVMIVWMGENKLLPFPAVVLMVVYFFILKYGDMRTLYTHAAGLWWEMRKRSILEAVCNIVLNIVLAKFFGIYGIIIATLVTIFFINFIMGSAITFKHYFGIEKVKEYYLYHFKYTIVAVVICAVAYLICNSISIDNIYVCIIVRGFICLVFSNIVLWFVNRNNKYFEIAKKLILKKA